MWEILIKALIDIWPIYAIAIAVGLFLAIVHIDAWGISIHIPGVGTWIILHD